MLEFVDPEREAFVRKNLIYAARNLNAVNGRRRMSIGRLSRSAGSRTPWSTWTPWRRSLT